jgi:hypothetical protein
LKNGVFAASITHGIKESDEYHAIMRKDDRYARSIQDHRGAQAEQASIIAGGKFDMHHERSVAISSFTSESSKVRNSRYCDQNYMLGAKNSEDCGPGSKIVTVDECRWAATRFGFQQGDSSRGPFEIKDQKYTVIYPEGCFLELGNDPETHGNGVAWFVERGNTAASGGYNVTGMAICKRPRYSNGTINTNAGCTEGAHITTEPDCRTFADCEGNHLDEDSFRRGIPGFKPKPANVQAGDAPDDRPANYGDYNAWPTGCFAEYRGTEHGVMYNKKPVGSSTDPTNPQGTPICYLPETTRKPWTTASSSWFR